jgi:hypothetical protein
MMSEAVEEEKNEVVELNQKIQFFHLRNRM